MKFKTPYKNIERVQVSFVDEHGNQAKGRTQQHLKQETDINNIIRKYDTTGLITHVNNSAAQYGDFTKVNEYKEALDLVNQSNQNFMEIPSHIRAQFDNDAGKFFEFVTNPGNQDKMIELGLATMSQDEILRRQKLESENTTLSEQKGS